MRVVGNRHWDDCGLIRRVCVVLIKFAKFATSNVFMELEPFSPTALSSFKNWVGNTESRYKAHRTFERMVILEVTRREPLR